MTAGERVGRPVRPRHPRASAHTWGAYEVRPVGRGMVGDTHLLVYPPGTNAVERRWLQSLRLWPAGGACVAAVLMVLLSWAPSVVALGSAAAVYAAGWAVVVARTRRLRPLVRHVRTSVFLGEARPTVLGDTVLQHATYEYLCALDQALADGVISPVEFEQGWSAAWSAIPTGAQAPTIGSA